MTAAGVAALFAVGLLAGVAWAASRDEALRREVVDVVVTASSVASTAWAASLVLSVADLGGPIGTGAAVVVGVATGYPLSLYLTDRGASAGSHIGGQKEGYQG